MKAFKTVDVDVFLEMAAEWQSISIAQVTPKQRKNAKLVCYGLLYGMGPASLAEELKVSLDEAEVLVGQFKQKYSMIQRFYEQTLVAARQNGFVETICGTLEIR